MDTELKETREAWLDAFFAGDAETLRGIEDASFLVISSQGIQGYPNRWEMIAEAKANGKWLQSGIVYTEQNAEARVVGDVTIVWGHGETRFMGETTEMVYSETWQQIDGRWRILLMHYTVCPG